MTVVTLARLAGLLAVLLTCRSPCWPPAAAATTADPQRRARAEPDQVALHTDRDPAAPDAAADRQADRRHRAVLARRRREPVRGLDRQRHRRPDHADQGDLHRRPVPDAPARHPAARHPVAVRRGYPIYQPDQPACDRDRRRAARSPSTTPSTASRRAPPCPSRTRPTSSSGSPAARCLEIAIAKVAHLSWADEVTRQRRRRQGHRSAPYPGRRHDRPARPDAGHRHHRRQPGALPGRAGRATTRTSRSGATSRQRIDGPAQADPVRRARVRRVRELRGVRDQRAPRRQAGPVHPADGPDGGAPTRSTTPRPPAGSSPRSEAARADLGPGVIDSLARGPRP